MSKRFLKTLKHRRKCLWKNELDRLLILSQCGSNSNVLYADFRADEICLAYSKFLALGLNLDLLFRFQRKVPAIYPWNLEYAALRFDVNRRYNVFPLIIVMAETDKDVTKSLSFALKWNIPIVARGGSHPFTGYSLRDDALIIDQSKRKNICIRENKVKVDAGVLLGPLLDTLYKRKLVLPAGTCPNNCIAGYTLGAGLGFLTRKYGMTCDSLTEVKTLLASGDIVTANKDINSDLFWASQGGGGGNFGIALSFTFNVYPIDLVYTLSFQYAFTSIQDVIRTWQTVSPTLPNDITLDFSAQSNKGSVNIAGQYLGYDRTVLDSLLIPFQNLNPIAVEIQQVPYIEAVKLFSGTGRWLPFFETKNAFIDTPLTDEALNIIEEFMSIGTGTDTLALDGIGGINNDIPSDVTAFPYREGIIGWCLINSQWQDQDKAAESISWLRSFSSLLLPYISNKVYVNAPDEYLDDYLVKYYSTNLPRLVSIKNKYDPTNVFNYPQSIPTSLPI